MATLVGKQYTLLFSPDMSQGSWIEVPESQFIGSGSIPEFHFETSTGDKCFWRVAVSDVDSDEDGLNNAEEYSLGTDALVADTDGDGSTDWAEVLMAIQGGLPAGLAADPLNADTNGDGIPDGLQLDHDKDGIPDAKDIAWNDAAAAFEIGPVPRYVLFPITNAQPLYPADPPWQISDKGTVLYSNGTWTAGAWTPLPPGTTDLKLNSCQAKSINDNNTILGVGNFDVAVGSETAHQLGVCYWPAPGAAPATLSISTPDGDIFPSPSYDFAYGDLRYGQVLSNAGAFLQNTHRTEGLNYPYQGPGEWTLPGEQPTTHPATVTGSPDGLRYLQGPGLKWGLKVPLDANGNPDWTLPVLGQILAPGQLPDCPFAPKNTAALPAGRILAMSDILQKDTMAYYNGAWRESSTYSKAIDISTDGIAIGKNHQQKTAPMLFNGKWEDISRYAHGVTDPWDTQTTLLDTTPGGWVLATQGSGTGAKYGVLLPLKVEGLKPDYIAPEVEPGDPVPEQPEFLGDGVDSYSASATGGGGKIDQLAIMAPIGGSKEFRLKAPLNPASSLVIDGGGITIAPSTISSPVARLTLSTQGEPGISNPALRLGGNLASKSSPILIQAIKRRTVRIAVHPVALKRGSDAPHYPSRIPSDSDADRKDFKDRLTEFLDKIYGRQVNLFCDITVLHAVEVDFDTVEPLGLIKINYTNTYTPEMTVACTNSQWPDNADMDIWILGGTSLDDGGSILAGEKIGGTYGQGDQVPAIIVDGSSSVGQIIAHEMGHIFMGGGHPDVAEDKYFARLEGNSQENRLMKQHAISDSEFQLVKKEWDMIDAWLRNHIDVH